MSTQEEEEDIEINPFTMLLQIQNANETPMPTLDLHQQEYYFRSIESTVVIRQFPSQGISFQLWPAATTLVTLLDNHRRHPTTITSISPLLNGQLKILELGSGTGLVGIAAAAILGAKVTVTDLPHVLPNLLFNAAANSSLIQVNGGSVDVAPLGWGDSEHMKSIGRDFDIVLGSDVVYHDHLYEPLLETLRFLLLGGENEEEKKMVFVMGHSRRWKKESIFFKKARKYFDVQVLHTDCPPDGDRIGIVIYSFAAKNGCT